MIKLKSFFSFITRNAQSITIKLKQDLKSIVNTDNLDELNTKLSSQRGCYLLFDQTFRCLKEIDPVIEAISDQLVFPLESFSQNYHNLYKEAFEEILSLSNEYARTKQNVDKAKHKYIKSAVKTHDHESKMNIELKNKVNMPIEELTNHHDTLLRLRAQTENYAQLYKYEISKINQMNAINNKKHSNMIQKINTNEEARISVIKEVIVKYSKIITTYKNIYERLEDSILCLSNQINIQSDIETVSELFVNSKGSDSNGEMFSMEVFKEYIPPEINKDKVLDDKCIDQMENETHDMQNDLLGDFEIIGQITEYSSKYQDKLISEFADKIMSKEEVTLEEISTIIEMNNKNGTILFPKSFMSKFITKGTVIYHRLPNYDNLLHLATILNSFCLNSNATFDRADLNSLYYSIISLGERVCYLNKESGQTIYLCAVLSKQNEVYSTKSFWKEIMSSNLKLRLEASINNMIQLERLKPKKEKRDFFDLKNKINNLNPIIRKKSMLETTGLSKQLKNYHIVPEYQLTYLDNFASNDMFDIIRKFIPYLCQFNYSLIHSTELITELFNMYNIKNDKRGYLTLYLLSCDLTVKKEYDSIGEKDKNPNKHHVFNNKSIKKTLHLQIKMNSVNIKRNKLNLLIDKNASLERKAVMIFMIASHYLTIDEAISLLMLNKECLKQKKRILKNYFKKQPNISINHRIRLWFSLLNIGAMRRKYDYKTSIQKAEEYLELKYKNIIEYDVQRTTFPSNDGKHKDTLRSILTAIAYSKSEISYCQGMNYITSFVLQLFNYKEEAAYYFMLAIFEIMEYEQIYYPKLTKLKSTFFSLERLIELYLPKISDLFHELNINVNYFCPPWFLTLFTNASSSVDLNDPPIIVLRIWTYFFLSGWKALLISSLVLLKLHETQIFNLKIEEIFTFIVNTVSSTSMIHSNDYDQFAQMLSKYNITKNVLAHLNSEFELYQNLNNMN